MAEYVQNTEEELQEIAPVLLSLKQKHKKKIKSLPLPEHYFEELSEKIFDQTIGEKNKIIGFYKPNHFIYWAAASVALLVFLGTFLFPIPVEKSVSADLTSEEILQYAQENIEIFDINLLLEYATSEGNLKLETPLDVNQDDLHEYFENHFLNDIEEQTLNELL